MSFPRAAGILLHPSSLPSHGGIGDFGPPAYHFADFLASARQGVWQVLPLGPLGYGNSPYSSTSAFAGNPLLISLERLVEQGWIERAKLDLAKLDLARLDLAQLSPPMPDPANSGSAPDSGPVEYEQGFARKGPLLFAGGRDFVGGATG